MPEYNFGVKVSPSCLPASRLKTSPFS